MEEIQAILYNLDQLKIKAKRLYSFTNTGAWLLSLAYFFIMEKSIARLAMIIYAGTPNARELKRIDIPSAKDNSRPNTSIQYDSFSLTSRRLQYDAVISVGTAATHILPMLFFKGLERCGFICVLPPIFSWRFHGPPEV